MSQNVTSDDSQTPGFLDEVSKEIVLEAPSDQYSRPGHGDGVTTRIDDGEDTIFYSWTVGTISESKAAAGSGFNPIINGVDIDRLVRTMRCGERCIAKPKNAETSSKLIVTLTGLERSEDLTADGGLIRTTIRDGKGWQTPRVGTELRVRFGWRTVPVGRLPPPSDDEAVPSCVVLLAGEASIQAAESKELNDLRRELPRRIKGSPAVVTKIESSKLAPGGPVLRISHGETVLLDCPDGVSVDQALTKALDMPNAACSKVREAEMRVEAPANLSSELGNPEVFGEILCGSKDWIPGLAGRLALSDMRAGQQCFVRVQPAHAFAAVGLSSCGIPPNSALEYEVEILQIMTLEDVSLDRDKSVMKKITKEGDGYEKPVEGAEVTVTFGVHNGATSDVIVEDRELVFPVACGKFCAAFEETILTMKKGEHCQVRCMQLSQLNDKELGLSPDMDPAAVLCLELREFEKIKYENDAERVQHCAKRKEVGASFFKDGNWRRALKRYHHVVTTLSYIDTWKDEAVKAQAISLRRLCNLNVAACQLKLENWRDAEKACSAVLREEPDNVKALFRRGQSLKELAEYRDAEQCLKRVLEMDKENKEAARMLAKIKQFVKTEVAQQKQMFSKMLAGGSKPTNGNAVPEAPTAKPPPVQPPASTLDPVPSAVDDEALEISCSYIVGASALLACVAYGLYWSNKRSH